MNGAFLSSVSHSFSFCRSVSSGEKIWYFDQNFIPYLQYVPKTIYTLFILLYKSITRITSKRLMKNRIILLLFYFSQTIKPICLLCKRVGFVKSVNRRFSCSKIELVFSKLDSADMIVDD